MVNAKRLFLNSIASVGRVALSIGVNFFLTPFILWKIGVEAYGVWALVTAIVSYAALLDLGIPAALSKYFAEYYVKKQTQRITQALNTAFFTFLPIGLAVLLSLWMIRSVIFQAFFQVGSTLSGDLPFVFFGALLIFIFNFTFSVFPSLLAGLQRTDISATLNAVYDVSMAVFAVVALQLGFGLKGLVVAIGLAVIVVTSLHIIWAKRLYPSLTFGPQFFRFQELKHLLRFSLQMHFISFAMLIHTQFDKFLISFFLGVRFVAYYDIAGKIIRYLRNLPASLLSPVLPAASEIAALGEREKLQTLYLRTLKYMIVISLPLFTLLFLFASPFISLWLGEGYELSSYTLQFLLIANFINLLTGPGFSLLSGQGKIKYATFTAAISSVLNIILSFLFIQWFGFKGIVVGTSLSLVIAAVLFLIIFHIVDGISFWETFKKNLFVPLIAVLLMSLLSPFMQKFFGVSSYLELFLGAGVLGLLFITILFVFRYFDTYDQKKAFELLSAFTRRNKKS